MLKQYNQLLTQLDQIENKQKDLSMQVQNKKKECYNFRKSIELKNKEYTTSLAKEIDKMLQNKIAEVSSDYDIYRMQLSEYETSVAREVGVVKGILDSNSFVHQNEFSENFNHLEEMCNNIKDTFGQYIPVETIDLYTKLSYTINFKNGELDKIAEWLNYFDDFDEYDRLISKAEEIEAKLNSKEDKEFLVICILALICIIAGARVFILPVYFAFIFATLYIRCKEYFFLIKLLSVFNMINTKKEEMRNYYNAQISNLVDAGIINLSAKQAEHEKVFRDIREAISFLEEQDKEQVKKDFDYKEAEREAKKNLERDDAAITTRLEDSEKTLEALEEELSQLMDKRGELNEQLHELKNRIIESYQNLNPTFEETNLLSEFFLGFDKDTRKPVTFDYGGQPTVLFFQGNDNASYDAVIKTITMMCSQVMCIMSPTSYKINVIDTRTAGSQLSAFQVTSTKEDSPESQLFKVITTSQDAASHIQSLYDLFNARRIRILGNYNDIDDYNRQKVNNNAKPESFSINIFLHFDYKLLNQTEELKILCRVSKSIGIALIFMIDTEQVGKDDTTIKSEDLFRFLNSFEPTNLFGFRIINNSVDIVKTSVDNIKNLLGTKEG